MYDFLNNQQENTILFLHGWGGNKKSLAMLIPKNYTFNYLLLDLLEFGDNPKLDTYKKYDQIVEDIHKLILDLKLKITVIVGHSFGGKLSIGLAKKLHVKGLFLLAPSLYPKRRGIFYYSRVFIFKLMNRMLHKRFNMGSKDYKNASIYLKGTMSNCINYNITPLLKELNIPVLLLWGKKDHVTPFYLARKIKKNIKDCSILSYPEGHFFYLKHVLDIRSILNEYILTLSS